jgi:hypothetical protein
MNMSALASSHRFTDAHEISFAESVDELVERDHLSIRSLFAEHDACTVTGRAKCLEDLANQRAAIVLARVCKRAGGALNGVAERRRCQMPVLQKGRDLGRMVEGKSEHLTRAAEIRVSKDANRLEGTYLEAAVLSLKGE